MKPKNAISLFLLLKNVIGGNVRMSRLCQAIGLIVVSASLAMGCTPHTPLGNAVYFEDLQDTKALLASGADPCERVGRGEDTALDLAKGDTHDLLNRDPMKDDFYRALLEVAFQRVLQGKKCETILFYAARIGDTEKVKKLISLGEDPNQGEDMWESSPLGIATYYGHEETIRALIAGGARIDPQLENFEKLRLWAATVGSDSSYQKAQSSLRLLRRYQINKQQ